MALVDAFARKGSGERRAAPRIRRITGHGPVQTGHGRPAPMSAAMAARRERYAPIIEAAAARHGVDANLVHGVIRAESAYEPAAESHAGARGPMHLMPATARRFGVRDIWDPAQNIRGGVVYLRFLLDRFGADIPHRKGGSP
jgi:soluble lytic murein transglycosylase-like protein